MPSYNLNVVLAYFREFGIPPATAEYWFHPERNWRFDFAWVPQKIYLEVQGGVFAKVKGAHARGAFIRKEHEKRNAATILGWRGLWIFPEELMKITTPNMIIAALAYRQPAERTNEPPNTGNPGTTPA